MEAFGQAFSHRRQAVQRWYPLSSWIMRSIARYRSGNFSVARFSGYCRVTVLEGWTK